MSLRDLKKLDRDDLLDLGRPATFRLQRLGGAGPHRPGRGAAGGRGAGPAPGAQARCRTARRPARSAPVRAGLAPGTAEVDRGQGRVGQPLAVACGPVPLVGGRRVDGNIDAPCHLDFRPPGAASCVCSASASSRPPCSAAPWAPSSAPAPRPAPASVTRRSPDPASGRCWAGPSTRWSGSLLDWRLRELARRSEPARDVVLVGVDDETLASAREDSHAELGIRPWPRALLGRLVTQLGREGASPVLLDWPLDWESPRQGGEVADDEQFRRGLDGGPASQRPRLLGLRCAPAGGGASAPALAGPDRHRGRGRARAPPSCCGGCWPITGRPSPSPREAGRGCGPAWLRRRRAARWRSGWGSAAHRWCATSRPATAPRR